MTSRAEITTRYARAFKAADKRTKGRILDEVVSVTGWSRDNARRRLIGAAQSPPGAGRSVATRPRRQRATKYSYDALKVLQRVASGGQCGKYLAASMRTQLDGLERHGELVDGVGRYSMAVRAELLAMSAASIDRYLRPAKATDQIKGVTTTNPRRCCGPRSRSARPVGALIGGSTDVEDVTPGQCSRPVPALTCVTGNGWVRSSGESPRRPALPGVHK